MLKEYTHPLADVIKLAVDEDVMAEPNASIGGEIGVDDPDDDP